MGSTDPEDDDVRRPPVPPDLTDVDFDELVVAVRDRMHGAVEQQTRVQLLLDAVLSISADLSLDGVLSRMVEIAMRLAGARYGALGVLSSGGSPRLRTFVHHGISDDVAELLGDLPEGHGLLGHIIDRPEPLRLSDLTASPLAHGFPPGHPPMRSFLGVPVRLRDSIFGNLYLTDKVGDEDFTAEDEEIVAALAVAAGVAIENARLYEEAMAREEWAAATATVVGLVSDPDRGVEPLQAVAELARQAAGAAAAWTVAWPDDDTPQITATSLPGSAEPDPVELIRWGSHGDGRRSVQQAGDDLAEALELPDLGPLLVVPLSSSAHTRGSLVLVWRRVDEDRCLSLDDRVVGAFAEQAELALQLVEARDDQRRLAVLEDRDRIAQDLHDLVIQRLFAVGLDLQRSSRLVDVPMVAERLEAAVDDIDATIKDIRRAIFGLGSLDGDGDIQTEATRVVERAAATLKFRPSVRFDGPVRSLISTELAPDLLAVLAEALSNASRHAEATAVEVTLCADDDVVLEVRDNGRGIDEGVAESGLANIRARAERRGGSLQVKTAPGDGTTIVWSVPR